MSNTATNKFVSKSAPKNEDGGGGNLLFLLDSETTGLKAEKNTRKNPN